MKSKTSEELHAELLDLRIRADRARSEAASHEHQAYTKHREAARMREKMGDIIIELSRRIEDKYDD